MNSTEAKPELAVNLDGATVADALNGFIGLASERRLAHIASPRREPRP